MRSILLYFVACLVIAAFGFIFCKMYPKSKQAEELQRLLKISQEKNRKWLLVLSVLISPVIALVIIIVWALSEFWDDDAPNQQTFMADPALVIRNAMFIIFTEQEKGIFPIIRPLSINSLPLQSVIYRGVPCCFQLCAEKQNITTSKEEAEAFRLRVNASIVRHLKEGTFPGILCGSEDGINPLFKVGEACDRGLYWDLYIVPGNCHTESSQRPTPLSIDSHDNDF